MRKFLLAVILLLGTALTATAQDFNPQPAASSLRIHLNAPVLRPECLCLRGANAQPVADGHRFRFFARADANSAQQAASPVSTGGDKLPLQIGFGYEYVRFRSAAIDRSLNGIRTSVTWYLDDTFGIEGNVVAAFGSTIFSNEHPKYLLYTAGPKIVWTRHVWQPWGHALIGGLHMLPQIAGGFGQNSFAAQLGGGVDYRLSPGFSLRVEGDYVRSQLYSTGQNNFQVGTGFAYQF